MKTLKDLKMCPKAKAKVEAWLEEWLAMLKTNADYKEGNVYRADFEKMDFFYFTDCRDILSNKIESKAQETNIKILIRKRYVMNQLLVKAMLGTLKLNKIKCSHCGYEDVWIDHIEGGFFKWCPKCSKTDISVFPGGFDTCVENILKKLKKKYGPVKCE